MYFSNASRAAPRMSWFVCLAASLTMLTAVPAFSTLAADEQKKADAKSPTETIRKVPVGKMKSVVDGAIANKWIISDLKPVIAQNQVMFDVTISTHPDNRPWMILLNMTDQKYADACAQYGADGYQRLVDKFVVVDGQRIHSVVWVQPAVSENTPTLQIPAGPLPESGTADSRFEPLDQMMRTLLVDHHLPGATLSVSRNGRLLYSRGFGYQGVASGRARSFFAEPMPADAAMRIASISKPITAVAVLQLVERGLLKLDQRVTTLLGRIEVPETSPNFDPRWKDITVLNLLQHTGGWDRGMMQDPMFQVVPIARELKLRQTAKQDDIIRHQLVQPLDSDPGTTYAYSNFGYCLLGRIIETVSGQKYETFVKTNILDPAGMRQTRLGQTRLKDRGRDEVYYYTQRLSEFPGFWESLASTRRKTLPETVPEPYGRWDLEVMDSHGGWVSTGPDLLRFLVALERTESPLLNAASREMMLARPTYPDATSTESWYGCGWSVRPGKPGAVLPGAGQPVAEKSVGTTYWHTGSFAGTSSLLVHRSDGFSWAILFNIDEDKEGHRCCDLADPLIHQALAAVPEFPDHDLFKP